MTLCHCHLH